MFGDREQHRQAFDLSKLEEFQLQSSANPLNLPPDVLRKMDAHLQRLYSTEQLPPELVCIARLTGSLSADQKKALTDAGVTLRADLGAIITISYPAASIGQVLGLPFIVSVGGSQPLTPIA